MRAATLLGRIRRSIVRMIMTMSVIVIVGSTAAGFLASTHTRRACGAVVRLAVGFRFGGRVRGRFIRGLADSARFVVDTAHFGRLLPHAFVVDNVFSPLNVPLLSWFSA